MNRNQIVATGVMSTALLVNGFLLMVPLKAMDCVVQCGDGSTISCSGQSCEGIDGIGCLVVNQGFENLIACPST